MHLPAQAMLRRDRYSCDCSFRISSAIALSAFMHIKNINEHHFIGHCIGNVRHMCTHRVTAALGLDSNHAWPCVYILAAFGMSCMHRHVKHEVAACMQLDMHIAWLQSKHHNANTMRWTSLQSKA